MLVRSTFFSSIPRGIYWIAPIILFFLTAIPASYTLRTDIPRMAQLSYTRGEIQLVNEGKYGPLIKINGLLFTCATAVRGNNKCVDLETEKKLVGKLVDAHWFEQSPLPFVKRNILVDMTVEGRVVLTRDDSVRHWENGKDVEKVSLGLTSVFCVGLAIYSSRKKRKSNSRNWAMDNIDSAKVSLGAPSEYQHSA